MLVRMRTVGSNAAGFGHLKVGASMSFNLDFAPHLGFPTPDTPLFGALAGSTDPEVQIEFAASRGFKRVQDPFTARRSVAEQKRIGEVAAAAGVSLGCFVYDTIERCQEPAWSGVGPHSQRALDRDVENAIEIGRRIGSKHIAVLTGIDGDRSHAQQRAAMASSLRRLANRVADHGMMLCIEAVNAKRLPTMLLHHFGDALEVVREADHPAVRLIFDFAHVQAMDGDILGNLDAGWDFVELIQIADHPNRVQPGAGELNFVTLLDELVRRDFRGPCELEHLWSEPGTAVQSEYLYWLRQWANTSIKNGDDSAD
jgi:hydroxypyruvate isomerase